MQFLQRWISTFASREFDDWRRRLGILHDIVITAVSFAAAGTLAIGFDQVGLILGSAEKILLFIGVSAVICYLLELTSGTWRYASIPDSTAIGKKENANIAFAQLREIAPEYALEPQIGERVATFTSLFQSRGQQFDLHNTKLSPAITIFGNPKGHLV